MPAGPKINKRGEEKAPPSSGISKSSDQAKARKRRRVSSSARTVELPSTQGSVSAQETTEPKGKGQEVPEEREGAQQGRPTTSRSTQPPKPQKKKKETRLFEHYQDATWVYIGYPASKEKKLGDLTATMCKVKELAKLKKLNVEVTAVASDAAGSIKIRVKTKEQALLLESLKLKLDKEIQPLSYIKEELIGPIIINYGLEERIFASTMDNASNNRAMMQELDLLSINPNESMKFISTLKIQADIDEPETSFDSSTAFPKIEAMNPGFARTLQKEVSGVKHSEALVRLKRVPRQIPKTIPVRDWNITVVAPTSSTRGKCPLCGINEHKGGCANTYRYDPKMNTEEKAKVEALRYGKA
ncbi:hypothetical protein BDZ91DRAFT_758402 [Kalaharituber pfeilii]|nr:hypothetical protein BDZ91DRAFT_758402 [Kalaharituber pfeilii]